MVAGEGPERDRLERLARERRLNGRAIFAGGVSEQELADLYARCLAVYYAPVDEDFGMVPYEAFLAEKPVVTTTDAGAPLEVVGNRETGLVCDPTPTAVAQAFAWLRDHPDETRAYGRAGQRAAKQLTWDAAIDRLLA